MTVGPFDQWAIVELMGHVRIAGRVTEEERFGAKLGRIDVPHVDGSLYTQYFGGGSVYRLTPVTEEVARSVAKNAAAPVQRWELPAIEAPQPGLGLTAPPEEEWDKDKEYEDGEEHA